LPLKTFEKNGIVAELYSHRPSLSLSLSLARVRRSVIFGPVAPEMLLLVIGGGCEKSHEGVSFRGQKA